MKFSPKILFAGRALLVAALALPSAALFAQNDAPPAGEMRPRGPNLERQLQQLTETLSLSADQQTQVKVILSDQREKMEALRKSSAGADASSQAGPPNREQMDAIRNDTDTKISALLNDDQKAKFAQWQAQRKERMQRRGGADGPPPSGI